VVARSRVDRAASSQGADLQSNKPIASNSPSTRKCEGIVLTISATLELAIGPRSRAEPLAPGSIAERVAWLSDLAVMVAPSRLASGKKWVV